MKQANLKPPITSPSERLKILRVSYGDVFNMIAVGLTAPDFVAFPKVSLPDGCRVLEVTANQLDRSFTFLIEHPSFPIHHPGMQLEIICCQWLTDYVAYRRERPPKVKP